MNISAVKVILTEKDILSLIEDFVQIEGLKIDSIEIKEIITVKGSYKKGVRIPFAVKLGLGSINGNIINIKIFKINILRIRMLKSVGNIAVKRILGEFIEYGISVNKDTVTFDLDKVSKQIPYVYFALKQINITEGKVEAYLENASYAENKKTEIEEVKKDCEPSQIKIQGEYGKVRDKIVEKVPVKYEKIVQYIMIIPDITVLLWRLFKDKRVKIKVKLMVAGIIAYLASPVDILPDFIPLVGELDDVAIAFFGLNAIINEIPQEIILENWQGQEDIILLTKEAINYISKAVGSYNVSRILDVTKHIFKKGNEDHKLAVKKQKTEFSEHNIEPKEAITVNEESDYLH